MSGEPLTRKVEDKELARVLAPFVDPPTKLGLGVLREFRKQRALPARPRSPHPRPPGAPSSKHVAPVERVPSTPRLRVPAPYKWVVALGLGGFAFGGLIAVTAHTTSVTALAPATTVRVPPALPEPRRALDAPKPIVLAWQPSSNARRVAVDALLAGRTRVALDHYRHVLASSASSSEREAIARLVHVLERELHSCEEQAGTPCGF